MTKKQRRDKESSAKSHRNKIMGEDRPSQTELLFRPRCRSIVNLARRWPGGKVAKKARIPSGCSPVVLTRELITFCRHDIAEV